MSGFKRALQARRTKRQAETGQDRAARLTANATVAIAVATAVAALVGVAQWFVLSGQLNEMRGATEDTKRAIEATIRVADEAKRQADIARESLTGQRRPWIDFGEPEVDEPLTFTSGGAVTLSIKVRATNYGESPAINTTFTNRSYLSPWPSGNMNEVLAKHVCRPDRQMFRGFPLAKVVMPHATEDLAPVKSVGDESQAEKENPHVWSSLCVMYQDQFGIGHTTGQLYIYIPDSPIILPAVGAISGKLKPLTGRVFE